jgi:hypothetical protein
MKVQKSLKSKRWIENVTYIKGKYGKNLYMTEAIEMANKLMRVEFL